jgi:hypothetical protein
MVKLILFLVCGVLFINCSPQSEDKAAVSQDTQTNQETNISTEKIGTDYMGQTIYVPIYSHIYIREKSRPMNLAATLSIRNTDAQNSIRVTSVRYYDSNGLLIRKHVNEPLRVSPMATTEFIVTERDTKGGSGANFIVEWVSDIHVAEPIVEAVMIGEAYQQGISFICPGRIIKNWINKQ